MVQKIILSVKQSKNSESLTLKSKAVQSLKMLGTTHPVTQYYIPENMKLQKK
jgi:hypothetical protein